MAQAASERRAAAARGRQGEQARERQHAAEDIGGLRPRCGAAWADCALREALPGDAQGLHVVALDGEEVVHLRAAEEREQRGRHHRGALLRVAREAQQMRDVDAHGDGDGVLVVGRRRA